MPGPQSPTVTVTISIIITVIITSAGWLFIFNNRLSNIATALAVIQRDITNGSTLQSQINKQQDDSITSLTNRLDFTNSRVESVRDELKARENRIPVEWLLKTEERVRQLEQYNRKIGP